MKKLYSISAFLILIVSLQSCMVSQKPKMDFFASGNYDQSGAKFVSINVPMFLAKPIVKRALRDDGESAELINLISKVSDIKVTTIENGNQKMMKDFAKYLSTNNFEEWITVKKETETINFSAKQKGEVIKNLMISINSAEEMVLVDVIGKFTADDISRIINYSDKKDITKLVSK